MYKEEKLNTDYIIDILHNISFNYLPHEVETFVRNCNTTKYIYNQHTLISSSDFLMGSSGNPAINLNNMDFFLELSATPEEWKGWLAKKQELLNELISGDNYDPLDPSQRQLESRIRKRLPKDYVNYNDYNPFDASNRLQHKPVEPEPDATYTSLDDKKDGYDDNSISSALQRHVESRLQKKLQKAVKAYENYNDYDPLGASEQQKSRKQKAPPITYDDDDLFVSLPRKQHTNHHHTTCRLRCPPKFISCPNGILFCVLSHNDSQKMVDTSRTDLENLLLLQGKYFSRQLRQMSQVFTHDALEQALLQEPKGLEFVKTLH